MAKVHQRPRVVLVNRCFVLDEQRHVLLIRRSNSDSFNAGLWEAPGGKLDVGQDLTHALEREVAEETNLVVRQISNLVFADSFVIGVGPYKGLPYVALFGIAELIGGHLRLSQEHDSAIWTTYRNALDLELTTETHKALVVLQRHLK